MFGSWAFDPSIMGLIYKHFYDRHFSRWTIPTYGVNILILSPTNPLGKQGVKGHKLPH